MDYRSYARQVARQHGLDPDIFSRQIQQESGFNPGARSGAGAIGIAQFMPGTARGLGINPNDPKQALNGAAKLMANYVRQFGSYKNALVAYNAGPGAVGHALPTETKNYIHVILGGSGGGSAPSNSTRSGSSSSGRTSISTTTSTPGVDNSGARAQVQAAQSQNILNFLQNPGVDPLDFALQAKGLNDQLSGLRDVAPQQAPSSGAGSSVGTGDLVSRANALDSQHLPYKWGGGHGGKVNPFHAVPVDCSGAVSSVLGIDPRVSGQFASWGKPGRAQGGQGVTVYSNSHHVLMEINGHFFGTSASNPGGGAGWIPRGQISQAYLRGFTARHA